MTLYFQLLTYYLKITRDFVSQTIVCHYFEILSFLTAAEMGWLFFFFKSASPLTKKIKKSSSAMHA